MDKQAELSRRDFVRTSLTAGVAL
ncbi:MAG: twin-arginine translocation signal domain-containing protein, partial [Verrucomicrobia bacterium]|nr:twin-arginine translocation signal domain-containing protein [Verrucomicrobiota bacterium]